MGLRDLSGLSQGGAPASNLGPRGPEVARPGERSHVRGCPARILQHEMDHLDGTLYIDRMVSRSFSTGEQARDRYADQPIAEVLASFGLTTVGLAAP